MSNVPFGRDLLQLALNHGTMDPTAKALVELALAQLTREPPVRRAPRTGVRLTKEKKDLIREVEAENPTMTMHEIAEQTGVHNIGRVSEVLTGKR